VAEQSANGNGERFQRAAEGALLQVVARWFIVAGLPVFGALIGYIGLGWLAEMRAQGEALRDLAKEVRTEFKDSDSRVTGIDLRLTATERDVQYLKGK